MQEQNINHHLENVRTNIALSSFHRSTKDKPRYCRCGAGVEENAGQGDTPGFKICDDDVIEMDQANGIKRLILRRREGDDLHMKSTSTKQLQSWRGNVDTQILIFECDPTDPKNFDLNNLMQVTRYVTAYACKGSESYLKEQQAIANLVLATEKNDVTESNDIIRITKQVLNSFLSKRVISRAEACHTLLGLDLVMCSEPIEDINISAFKKVGSSLKTEEKGHVLKYSRRKGDAQLSLHEYYSREQVVKGGKKNGARNIPNFCGMSATAQYPVTVPYARASLIVHKPWSSAQPLRCEVDPLAVIEEFHEFLDSDGCNVLFMGRYVRARDDYKSRMMFKAPRLQTDVTDAPYDSDDSETENLVSVANGFADKGHDWVQNLDKGLKHDWANTSSMVGFLIVLYSMDIF